MPHLHAGPGQHDFTTSAFIVRTDGPEPTVMLHLHRKIGMLLQFGGHIELDENPWQGLVRELREESGYEPEQLNVLQPPGHFGGQFPGSAIHPVPFLFNTHSAKGAEKHFHSELTYAVVAAELPRHVIGHGESDAIHQLTAAQIKVLSDNETFGITRASALFVLEQLFGQWQAVPATEWPT